MRGNERIPNKQPRVYLLLSTTKELMNIPIVVMTAYSVPPSLSLCCQRPYFEAVFTKRFQR